MILMGCLLRNNQKRFGHFYIRKGAGYAVLISILPVVMHYKVPIVNVGISTVLVAVSMIYAGLVIISKINKIKIKLILPLYCCLFWMIIKSEGDFQSILLCISIIIHLSAISTGVVDCFTLKRWILVISCMASIFVIIQQIVHILFSIHLPMIAYNYVLDNMQVSYSNIILTGYPLNDISYRPSAFFLEPAHFAQYCFIGMSILLLDKDLFSIPKAILISIGIICTTSGMGIGMICSVWGYYCFTVLNKSSLSMRIKRLLIYSFLFIILVFISLQIPIVKFTISRIITKDNMEYNAISGRLFWWNTYIANLSGENLISGLGISNTPQVYFTGIMELIYCYGIIGLFFFYLIICKFCFVRNKEVRFYSLMMGILMIFANLVGFISFIFYFGVMTSIVSKKRSF